MNKTKLFILGLISLFIMGCSEYNRVLKTDDLKWKYEMAIKYYDAKSYDKAYPLLEDLIIIYRGTPKAELLSYYLCNCDFFMHEYSLASFRYKNFASTYPLSQYTEECEFKSAFSQYMNSPKYSLDQSYTYSAINGLQLFAEHYPGSTFIDSCNALIDDLRAKLERKYYENAKQYLHTKNYKSSIVAFNNLLSDFPGTIHSEEAHFMLIQSNYLLAINSIEAKKLERFDDSIKSYIKFVDSFPNSKHIKEAEMLYDNALREKEKVNSN